ncbi:hypothetical protein FDECE_6172 [Fusarium decemcellulare]|nr:hypothetical protein FDECE_6172 [Fusarium decemcellulare]
MGPLPPNFVHKLALKFLRRSEAMDLSKLKKKTYETTRGFTYTCYISPAQGNKPTILLLHGWPDTAKLWAGFINNYLLPNGYGVIAPDLLGYGESSKPDDPSYYAWDHMAADLIEILTTEEIPRVVSLGHDWGSSLAQRLYNFFPSRVSGLIMINVAYNPPAGDFDLDAVNAMLKQTFGLPLYEYWHFICSDDTPGLLRENLESAYTVVFGEPETWAKYCCEPGAMREFVTEGQTQPTLPYATAEHKEDFMKRFGDKDAFDAPTCWYKATVFGIQSEADKLIEEDSQVVNVPTLFWGGEKDVVCPPAILQLGIQGGYLPNVKSITRDTGHWGQLEKPVEFGEDILGWLKETFD